MKPIHYLPVLLVLTLACTKTVEKIVCPESNANSDKGAIVGLVKQTDSQAWVVVRQALPLDTVRIDPATGQYRFDNLAPGNYDLSIKAAGYGTSWVRGVVVSRGAVAWVGETALRAVPDLVTAFYPEDRDEIVFDRNSSQLSISILFSEEMDRASVEKAFATDPPTEGLFFWGYYATIVTPTYFWNDDSWADKARNEAGAPGATITTFSKVKAFTYRVARKDCFTDTTYRVTLATGAKDTAGVPLEFPLSFSFRTVQSATTQNTIQTSPEHGDDQVDPLNYSSLTMTFPRRMNQASVESALTITPKTDAVCIWPAAQQLRIYTGGPLHCSTHYTLSLAGTAEDLDGVALGEPFVFSFDTMPFKVESTSPQHGTTFVSRNTRLSIQFNTWVSLTPVTRAVTIEPAVKGSFLRGYEYGQGTPKDVITFIPSDLLAANTRYTVTISADAADLYGTTMPAPYTFVFITEPE
ncbi:MAG TPA: Ig-like domain-containing protein [bacterium]|nr:Ig-like domain-containing protein [bacterium]HPR88954.1 Ig-like domain-containing protein [bacterium]